MNLREIYLAARSIPDVNHRLAFVEQACGSDAGLRRMIESVLQASEEDGDLPIKTTAQHAVRVAPVDYGQLGPYRLREILGQGGMGMVYRADDLTLNRQVAVKVLLPTASNDPRAQDRFLREAMSAAQLDHENVVPIYHIGDAGGIPYLVMPLLRGESLDRWIERGGRCSASQIARLGIQVARGLAVAHAQGMIHRDIKPGNIWLDEGTGRARILDFGLARGQGSPALTQTGMVVGTPGYMAPEQALGEDLDPRCDLFSLGAVLYQLATGKLPFQGPTAAALLTALVLQTPKPIREMDPSFPKELGDLIMQMLARNPVDRPGSARVVIDRLRVVAEQLPPPTEPMLPAGEDPGSQDTDVLPRRAVSSPQPERSRSRRWAFWGTLVGGLLLLVLGSAFWLAHTRPGHLEIEVPEAEVDFWLDGVRHGSLGANLTGRFYLPPGLHQVSLRRANQEMMAQEVDVVPGRVVRLTGTWLPRRFTNRLGMEFVLIPRGKSILGGGGGRIGDRTVEIRKDFYLGAYEVTQDEWDRIMGPGRNPSRYSRHGENCDLVKEIGDDDLRRFPVDGLSWKQTQEFLEQLNLKAGDTGWIYQLPGSDEWEYACRGGSQARPEDLVFDYYLETPTNKLLPERANFAAGGLGRPWKVGSGRPNVLGLYDMHGNVFEICAEGVPGNEPGEILRRFRGGFWNDPADVCQASRVGLGSSHAGYAGSGFRVARVPVAR